MGLGVGSAGMGLAGVLSAVNISILSVKGERQAANWRGFMRYLRSITRGREGVESPRALARYLPYAAGFGFAAEWAKYFQKMVDIPVPNWFRGLPSSVGDGTEAVIAAIVAADSSAAAASIGAAGASGGGASGAG